MEKLVQVNFSILGGLVRGGFSWGGGVFPTTPDPHTPAKVSRYKWEPHRDTNWWCMYDFPRRGGHASAKSIAMEMGGVSQYFSKVSGSGLDFTFLIFLV